MIVSGRHTRAVRFTVQGKRYRLVAARAVLLLSLVPGSGFVFSALAGTVTWSGAVSTSWSAPANWVGGVVPASGDGIVIPGSLSRYPIIAAGDNVTAQNVQVQTGGSLSQTGGVATLQDITMLTGSALTVTGGDLLMGNLKVQTSGVTITQSGGTIQMHDMELDPGSSYTQSGGTLKFEHSWKVTGTFVSTGGTVDFIGSGDGGSDFRTTTFYNVIVEASVDPKMDNFVGSIAIGGNFTNYNTGLDNSLKTTFVFSGTGTQNIYSNASVSGGKRTFGHLVIDKSAGAAVVLTSNLVDGNITVLNGTLDLGSNAVSSKNAGVLTVASNGTLLMGGPFPTGFSSVSLAATSTMVYNGGNQTITGAPTIPTYGNLILSGTGTKTLGGNITVTTKLSMQGSTAFAPGGYTLTYGANATLEYKGSVAQTTGPSFPSTMSATQTVIIDNPLGVTLSGTKTVNGTLRLTSGSLITGANTLIIGPTGTVQRGSGYVVGNLQKTIPAGSSTTTFEVGDAGGYAPVQVDFSGVTTSGGLIVRSTAGDHPSIGTSAVNPARSVNRYWTITNGGVVFSTYNAAFDFTAGALDPGADPNIFMAGRYASAAWTLPTVGTKTSTRTQVTGLTAFGDFQLGEPAEISGTVFEDFNYGGGAGRDKTTSGGVGRGGARVELYDASGIFSASRTTDANGAYSFNLLSTGTYYVRVVNDSVSSSRTNYTTNCKPVQTYRTDAPAGTATAVTDWVGGTNPAVADAGMGSVGTTINTSTYVFSAGIAGTAQSVSKVVYSGGRVAAVDFGFSFNAIVNTNNSGQGSLRQFIINANTLGGDAGLAQAGLVAGKDNAVFMISNGTPSAGLRSSINYLSGGVATISPAGALPVISTVLVLDAQKQPGWSSAPIIELNGTNAGSGARGLDLSGGSSVVRGFVINRFTGSSNSAGIWISGAGQNTIQGNYLGTNAAGSAASANYQGIYVSPNISSNIIGGPSASQRNVMSGNTWRAVYLDAGSAGNTIRGNYVGLNAAGTAAVANSIGIYLMQAPNNTVGGTGAGEGNVLSGNTNFGLYLVYAGASGNTVQGNTIGLNAARSAAVPNGSSGIEFCCAGNGPGTNTIGGTGAGAANVISGNTGRGILMRGGTGNAIRSNSIYGNGGIGIDLGADNVTLNNGTKDASLPNYDMDYPVFTSATLSGTSLTVAGFVGSAANQSTFKNAQVEIFKSDNDATGYGEGRTYLGSLSADGNGNFSGSLIVAGVALGDRITGTATDGTNNTSEFGPNSILTGIKIVSTATGGTWSAGSTWVGGVVPTADNPVDIVSGATVTLDGNITRNAGDTLSVYGTLSCGANIVSGAGPFTIASGGTLGIGDPAGISASGATGNIQVSGSRSFSTGASYTFNGSSAQATGTGLPATVNNLTVNNSAGVTLAGSTTVNGTLTLTNGVFGIGVNTLTLNGNVSAASGSLTSGAAGTVVYNRGSDGQAVLASNYGNLTLSNFKKTLAASGTIGIAGTFTPGSAVGHTVTGSTVAFNGPGAQTVPSWFYANLTLGTGGTKTAGGNLALEGTLTIGGGVTFDAGSFTHTVQGDWSNGGTLVAGTSTIQMSGGSNAAISGTNTFNILTVNKSASSTTITLNNSITVGTLNMTQGAVLTGSNSVSITGDRTGNGVITGTITRTHSFAAGVAYAFESPSNTMTFASGGTLPGSVTMTVVLSSPGANSSMEPIGRYYDLSQTGGSGFSFTLRLHYEDGEVTAPNSETSPPLQLWRRTSAGPDVWERKGATASNTVSNWVEAAGQTDLGRWTLSSRTVPNVILAMGQSHTNPSPGQVVTYTITYNNTGDGPAGTVLITASAPVNTSYVSGNTALNGIPKTDQSGDDEVTVAGSTITINLGTVAAGASGAITYKVLIQ